MSGEASSSSTAFARAALGAALLAGCASTSAAPGFRDMARTIGERTGHRPHWDQDTQDDESARRAVRELLSKPLTVDGAVQVALLEDPSLQAIYEDLSLAQADVVQAGLLSNPVFAIGMTTAERENLDPNLVAGLTQSFLDLVLLPARKKIAASQFDAAKFRVGNAVLEAASRVAIAFYTVEAATQALAVTRTIAEAEDAALDLTERQQQAGNVGDLAVANERALASQMRLDVVHAEAELATAREDLARRLGLKEATYATVGHLPELPAEDPPLDRLEEQAMRERLDLASLRQEMDTLGRAASLARASRWTGVVDVGADVARLKDGSIAVGPRASIELPIFDQRQAAIARIEAQERKSEDLLAALEVEARAEVRAARERLLAARKAVELYRTSIIPAREQTVALSQQHYDAMLLGVYPLIAAKQAEASAYREYITSVRDYWIARTDLEQAAGGRALPVSSTPPSRGESTP